MSGTPGFISDWPAGTYSGDKGLVKALHAYRDKTAAASRLDRHLELIRRERWAQNDKWGEQNHPDGTTVQFKGAADQARLVCDLAAREGCLTWTNILLEEVHEALAEEDSAKLHAELIQVAAVATAWAEAIDRRGEL